MADLTFRELLRISIVIPILLVFSVICLGVAVERWIAFFRYVRLKGWVLEKIRILVKNGNLKEARTLASQQGGIVAEAIVTQLDAVNLPRSERESLILFHHQRFQAILSKRLWIFGTLSFTCPLIGLFGTVLGVIRAFHDLAVSGSGGPTIVAAGISEALYATAGGIFVAIVAAIFYNYFNIRLKGALTNVDLYCQEIIFLTSGNKK